MVKIWSDQVRTYMDGFDVGTSGVSVTVTLALDTPDKSVFGGVAEEFHPGVRTDSFAFSGLFDGDPTANGPDSMSTAIIGSAGRVVSVIVGTSTGNRAFCGTGIHTTFDVPMNVKELVQFDAGFQPNQAWGACEHFGVRGTIASGGSSGSIDNGTESTNGLTLFAHMFNTPTGTAGTSRLNLEHSTNGSVWVTLLEINTNPGNTAVSTTTAGTIDRFLRLQNAAITGTLIDTFGAFVRT